MTPGTAYQHILDRLTASGATVRVVPDGAMATCPAHPDRNPSLHIARGDKGAVVTCHAGCAVRDVCAALGMVETDLFDNPLPARGPAPLTRLRTLPRPQPVAEYIYTDADGTPVLKVTRYVTLDGDGTVTGKTFRQSTPSPSGTGWVPRIGDLEPPLYHLPEVLAAVRDGQRIWVVEGEKDADTLVALGHVATTASGGAGKWAPQHTAALKGADTVMVIADDDGPGRAHALTVQTELAPLARVVVTLLPADGTNDLSEHLEAGHGIPDLRPVDLTDAPSTTPDRPTGSVTTPRLLLTRASAFRPARVHWGWAARMPIGEITLIPGREGIGKSLFLAWLAAQLTRGTLPGEFLGRSSSVLYVASEDSWRYTITPRLIAADADLDLVYRVDTIEADEEGRLTLPADCDALADAARDVSAAAVMLDPVISLIDENLSVNQSQQLRRALEPLRRAAEKAAVIMPALAHFNKATDVDLLSKIPGSRAWVEVARAAFAMGEDLENDDTERNFLAQQVKNNLGRIDLPTLTYKIEEVMIPTDDGAASVGRLVWTGESMSNVADQLSRRPERRSRDVSDNTKALVAYIEQCGYPVQLADIYAAFPDLKPNTIRQTLVRAADNGTVSNPLRGHYGPGGLGP